MEDFKEGGAKEDEDLTLNDEEKIWYTILFGTDFDDDYPSENPDGKSKGKPKGKPKSK